MICWYRIISTDRRGKAATSTNIYVVYARATHESTTGFLRRTMESGDPASSRNCNSGVRGLARESGRRQAQSMYSPRTIFSCKLRSSGRVRPRSEADPSRSWRRGCTATGLGCRCRKARRRQFAWIHALWLEWRTTVWGVHIIPVVLENVIQPRTTQHRRRLLGLPSSFDADACSSSAGVLIGDGRLPRRREYRRFTTRPESAVRGLPAEDGEIADVAVSSARVSCGRGPLNGRLRACKRRQSQFP